MFTLIDREADDCTEFSATPVKGMGDARRLGRAFVAASHGGHDSALVELREAVNAFVESRRAAGEPPERVIVAFKDALALYGGRQTSAALAAENVTADGGTLYQRVFRWVVDAYYQRN